MYFFARFEMYLHSHIIKTINGVLTLLCKIFILVLSAYVAILLRGPDEIPISTHTRMTIVSLQMLVCSLCLLAYFGCIFIVGRVRDAHYRMIILNQDLSDPEPGTLDSPVSLASIELSPREEDKTSESLPVPQANAHEHTQSTETMNQLVSVHERHLGTYVIRIHAIGFLLWNTLYYVDFYDIYSTLQFCTGMCVGVFAQKLLVRRQSKDIVFDIIGCVCTLFMLLNSYMQCDMPMQYQNGTRDFIIRTCIPVITGFAWVATDNQTLITDTLSAAGTSMLLCLPALMRFEETIVDSHVKTLDSMNWALLFIIQPVCKFLFVTSMTASIQENKQRQFLELFAVVILFYSVQVCDATQWFDEVAIATAVTILLVEFVTSYKAQTG
jgi:hypothetical protein